MPLVAVMLPQDLLKGLIFAPVVQLQRDMATVVFPRRAQSQVEGGAIDQKHNIGIRVCVGCWEMHRQDP